MTTDMTIGDIQIGQRHRKDYGDLDGLAASIKEVGLLQPIGVTPENVLVFGERRLRACRDILGWATIPAQVVDLRSILDGEAAENGSRKDYTPSEKVALVDALRSYRHGGDRRSNRTRTCEVERLTVEQVAKRVGFGGNDGYLRAKVIVERGVPELVEAMDRGEMWLAVAAEVAKLEADEQYQMLRSKESLTVKQVARYRMLKANGPPSPAQESSAGLTAPEPEKQSLLRRVAEVVVRLQSIVDDFGEFVWADADLLPLRAASREGVGLFQKVDTLIAERRVA
jgi:ParB-like chromosome segregation protein Spo0J